MASEAQDTLLDTLRLYNDEAWRGMHAQVAIFSTGLTRCYRHFEFQLNFHLAIIDELIKALTWHICGQSWA